MGSGGSKRGNSSTNPNSEFNAYWATPETITDDAWLLNSGLTSHVTNDLSCIDNLAVTTGKVRIIVGNGQKMGIE